VTADQPLTAEQYQAAMDLLAQAFRMVQLVPVAALRDHLSRAETLGPMLDPTAYMRGGRENLEDQADVIKAASAVMNALERIAKRRGLEHDPGCPVLAGTVSARAASVAALVRSGTDRPHGGDGP